MKKRGIAVLLAIAMLCPHALHASAEPQIAADAIAVAETVSESTDYAGYISDSKELIGKGEETALKAQEYTSFEGAELKANGEWLEWANAGGSVTYTFDVKTSGAYTLAIQELIDSGVRELVLPLPKVCYLISAPLELPSNFRLVLPRFAEIKLAKDSNCEMLRNKMVPDRAERIAPGIFDFVNRFSPDHPCENIEVVGGIWNCNNLEQKENPIINHDNSGYSGFGMIFYNVKNLRISSLTMKDPVTFSITCDTVSYFTVDNIVFDFNYGNPIAANMDGVHFNGNCSFGKITNLQGACYDDLIALNADEGTRGPIRHIDIDGIYAEDCHSAVRLLTIDQPVEYINIRNVFGTYFQYCIGLTKFYSGELHGYYDAINLENLYVSKAERKEVYNKGNSRIFQPIFIERDSHIKNLRISGLVRKEKLIPVETLLVDVNTVVDNLVLENVSVENHTDAPEMKFMTVNGTIKNLDARNIFIDGEKVEL